MSQNTSNIHKFQLIQNSTEDDFAEEEFFNESLRAEEQDICPKCYGSGWEVVLSEGVNKGARPCVCRNSKKKTPESLLEKARIPLRYENCHFNNYECNTPTQKEAHQFAWFLANNYPRLNRGALFMGSVGVGKTHLAVSLLKALILNGFSSLFYEFGTLIKEIQGSYNSNTQSSEYKILAPIFETEILLLDEIGSTKPTDWVKDTMAHIINTRYNDKKLTIFTTNYLDTRRTEEEILEDRIGVRLRSRLYEMCRTTVIEGEDYRRRKSQIPSHKK